ncbi:hypothetical protein GAMM_40289 [Gammaproteobacteria bacterium]
MSIPKELLDRISANDPTLTELNLSSQYLQLNSRDMQELANALTTNTSLSLLVLCDNDIKDDGAIVLASGLSNSSIKMVDVSINDIGDRGIEALLRSPISSLNVAGNSFSDSALRILSDNKTLVSLFVHENGLTDQSVRYFLANPRLLEITIVGNKISPAKMEAVQQHIKQNAERCLL